MPHPESPEKPDVAAGDFYDAMWSRYAHLDAASPAAFHRRRLVVALAAAAAPGARRILDAGCGQGELVTELGRRFPAATVAGADVSRRSLDDSRASNPGVDLFLLDLSAGGFEHTHASRLSTYDLIVCSEVLEHMADDLSAARRLFTLLSPGGHLIATVPGGKMSRFDEAIGHQRHYPGRRLAELLERAGFQVDDLLAWGFPFHSVYRTAVRIASRSLSFEPGEGSDTGAMPGVLGRAYSLFGRALKPLFYLNLPRWGEQMMAVAKKPLDR